MHILVASFFDSLILFCSFLDSVRSVAVSNDNRFIVSGSADKSIKIFDLQTKQELHQFKDAHTDSVNSVAVSNDNRFIVSGSADKSIKIFLGPNQLVELDAEIFYQSHFPFPWVSNLPGFENDLISPLKSSEFSNNIFLKFDGFYLTPFYWTSLHIVCIFQNTQFIDQLPPYEEFKIPFLLDRFGKTPLDYLILQEDIYYSPAAKVLNYMIDYLEDRNKRTADEVEMIFKSLTPLFPFILAKIDSKVRDRYLKAIFMASYSTQNINLPDFGFAQTRYSLSKRSIITPQILSNIHDEGTDQILFRTIMLYYAYNSFETDLYNIVWLLLYLQNEDIFKSPAMSLLIDYLWDLSQFIIKLSALPFCIYMILLSVYFALETRTLPLEIILVFLSLVLLFGEFIQMWGLRERYIQVLWNWLDLGHILLTMAFLIMRFITDGEDKDNLASNWISSIIIISGYMRWVSYLRIFKVTRNLIQIIISIIYDMTGFILILAFIIIGFSLIFLQFNRANEYSVHLYETYQVLFGNYNDSNSALSQKLLAGLILFLLNVVLLNLLISIMGDSYDKIQERRLLTDSETRLEMILEAMAYMRVFKRRETQDEEFLIYCLPKSEEEDGTGINEWEGRINFIRKTLKQTDQQVQEASKKTDEKMGKIERQVQEMSKKIDEKMDKIEQQVQEASKKTDEKMDEKMGKIEQQVQEASKKTDEKMGKIEEKIENIEENLQEILKVVNKLLVDK